ncbi:yhhT Predicted permease, member of the PurR regulon [Methylophilaceae bacterium]
MQKNLNDLTRTMLAIVFIALLGALSLQILRPFLPAFAWSTMIVIATWPMMLWVEAHLNKRRGLAVIVMTGLLLLLFFLPLSIAINSIVAHADEISRLPLKLSELALPPPPEWIHAIPFAGPNLAEKWQTLSIEGIASISGQLKPYAGEFARWSLDQIGSLGFLLLNFLLVVFISAVLYASGESATEMVMSFARRLAGKRGEDSVRLATQAVRAVALGIVLTALAQSLVGGFGLAVAHVPYAELLTVLMFILGVAQIGAAPVMLICSGWLFWQEQHGWGIAMLVWTVVVGSMDNVMRPLLIKRGIDLPLLVIFSGVIGGLISFGIIGLFIGPLVLAVTYTLLMDWIEDGHPAESQVS